MSSHNFLGKVCDFRITCDNYFFVGVLSKFVSWHVALILTTWNIQHVQQNCSESFFYSEQSTTKSTVTMTVITTKTLLSTGNSHQNHFCLSSYNAEFTCKIYISKISFMLVFYLSSFIPSNRFSLIKIVHVEYLHYSICTFNAVFERLLFSR